MPSDCGAIFLSTSRRKTHMPDCESMMNLKKRHIIVPERMALPRSRIGLFDSPLCERQRRAGREASRPPPPTERGGGVEGGGGGPPPATGGAPPPRAGAERRWWA